MDQILYVERKTQKIGIRTFMSQLADLCVLENLCTWRICASLEAYAIFLVIFIIIIVLFIWLCCLFSAHGDLSLQRMDSL